MSAASPPTRPIDSLDRHRQEIFNIFCFGGVSRSCCVKSYPAVYTLNALITDFEIFNFFVSDPKVVELALVEHEQTDGIYLLTALANMACQSDNTSFAAFVAERIIVVGILKFYFFN